MAYKRFVLIPFSAGLLSWLLMSIASAGVLDDFENAKTPADDSQSAPTHSTPPAEHHDRHGRRGHEEHEDDSGFGDFFVELFFRGTWAMFAYGGEVSNQRASLSPEFEGLTKRQAGELLIPEIRLDLNYQQAIKDIKAADLRFEYGEGRFAMQLRNTNMIEGDMEDHLRLSQLHGL
ncbi:MAG: hypothetical protein R3240_13135, partial [Gammaproteobacteria bacterium]|nr:hypothetical protein [Gammaproteobacteria bacterium]